MDVLEAIRSRHSNHHGFDAKHPLSALELQLLLEAAQLAPTFCNAQNFEILVVDDTQTLGQICELPADISSEYVHATFEHLRFGEKNWREGKVGLLAEDAPFMANTEDDWTGKDNLARQLARLGIQLDRHQTLLFALYDSAGLAPGSMDDHLQQISMGCVLQNLWLACVASGLGLTMMTVLSDRATEQRLRQILRIPENTRLGFTCAVGHSVDNSVPAVTVRRTLDQFVHRGKYRQHQAG